MKISYEGQEIDLTPPWNRMTMIEAVAKYTGQDFSGIKDLDEARKMADAINVPYEKTFGIGKIINACFEEHVEEKLIQPTFITGHPKEISPLAKSSEADPEITDRFEGFIMRERSAMASPSSTILSTSVNASRNRWKTALPAMMKLI